LKYSIIGFVVFTTLFFNNITKQVTRKLLCGGCSIIGNVLDCDSSGCRFEPSRPPQSNFILDWRSGYLNTLSRCRHGFESRIEYQIRLVSSKVERMTDNHQTEERYLYQPPNNGSAATTVVLRRTVNPFPQGKHCVFESHRFHQTLCGCSATGRGNGLRSHTVWVRIPPSAPFSGD
jgi:hypothetical protein